MIGIVSLGLWMLLIMYDNWRIKKRLDKLEERNEDKEKPKSCSTCRSYKGHAGHCEICHDMSMYKAESEQ